MFDRLKCLKSLQLSLILSVFLVLLSACQTTQSKEDSAFNRILQSSLPWDDTVVISPDDAPETLFDQDQAEDFFMAKDDFNIRDLRNKLGANQKSVAILLPLSGRGKSVGQDLLNAAQMALYDNAARNFVLRPYDTKGTSKGAKEAALDAIGENASLILGPLFSHAVEAVSEVAERADIPVIAFSNNRTVADENTFLIGTFPKDQAERVASYATLKGKKRIAIFAPDSAYGRMTSEAVKSVADRYGDVSIVKEVFFPAATRNFTPLVKKFVNYKHLKSLIEALEERKKANPFEKLDEEIDFGFDAIFVPVSARKLKKIAPLFAYFEIDLDKVKLLGTALWNDQTLGRDGTISGAWYAGTNPKGKLNFEKNYTKLYKKKPSSIASLGFDATSLAALMAKQKIPYTTESLTSLSGFEGLDGFFRFNEDGTNQRALSVIEIYRNYHKIIGPPPHRL
ncbi:MAG: penicillin-binding protein activator [Alphaproteobacteria bacterium]